MGIGLPLLLALAGQTAPQAAPLPIAVTESGLRIECTEAAPGDLAVRTPFGSLLLATDPVREVVDGAHQLEQMLALHRSGALDDLGLAQDLSTAGQLRALAEHAEAWITRDPEAVDAYLLLEAWGERIDPAPRDLAVDRRVDWLWDFAREGGWARTVLTGPRLRAEASAAHQARSERTVSIVRLRKALASRRPELRRVAAFVAGKQQEFSLRAPLLLASLEDPDPAARDGAAAAAAEVQPKAARDYWSRVLATGEPGLRRRAALDLGRHGGAEGMRVLVHVLACFGRGAGERFEFAGRDLFVVSTWDSGAQKLAGFDVNHLDRAFLTTDPTQEYMDVGSRFKVTKVDEALRDALLAALDLSAGERTGRDAARWLEWWLDNRAVRRP